MNPMDMHSVPFGFPSVDDMMKFHNIGFSRAIQGSGMRYIGAHALRQAEQMPLHHAPTLRRFGRGVDRDVGYGPLGWGSGQLGILVEERFVLAP